MSETIEQYMNKTKDSLKELKVVKKSHDEIIIQGGKRLFSVNRYGRICGADSDKRQRIDRLSERIVKEFFNTLSISKSQKRVRYDISATLPPFDSIIDVYDFSDLDISSLE